MSAPVFIHPDAAHWEQGQMVTLAGPEGRHAVTVQRRGVGERIDLVDGRGTRAHTVVESVGAGHLVARVESVVTEPEPTVVVVQALAKGGRDEQAVESATELGVTRVIPWAADRAIVQWRGPKADKGRAAWQDLAVAATKQSRRATIPTVDGVHTSAQLAQAIAAAVAKGAVVLLLHEDATTALATLTWDNPTGEVWVVVGPEGGIGDAERDRLTAAGAIPVVLGPHVLRASSAGPAALAALAALRGHWDAPREATPLG